MGQGRLLDNPFIFCYKFIKKGGLQEPAAQLETQLPLHDVVQPESDQFFRNGLERFPVMNPGGEAHVIMGDYIPDNCDHCRDLRFCRDCRHRSMDCKGALHHFPGPVPGIPALRQANAGVRGPDQSLIIL